MGLSERTGWEPLAPGDFPCLRSDEAVRRDDGVGLLLRFIQQTVFGEIGIGT